MVRRPQPLSLGRPYFTCASEIITSFKEIMRSGKICYSFAAYWYFMELLSLQRKFSLKLLVLCGG